MTVEATTRDLCGQPTKKGQPCHMAVPCRFHPVSGLAGEPESTSATVDSFRTLLDDGLCTFIITRGIRKGEKCGKKNCKYPGHSDSPKSEKKTSWLDEAVAGDKLSLDGLLRASTYQLRNNASAEEVLRWAAIHIRSLRLEQQRGDTVDVRRYRWAVDRSRIWTPRQREASALIDDPTVTELCLFGAMRTGKTDLALAMWLALMLERPSVRHGLVVQSLPSLNRVLNDLDFWAHLAGVRLQRRETTVELGDIEIQPVVANTTLSGDKVRGDTWGTALFEEAPELPAEAFDTINTRLSEKDFKAIYTGNSGPLGRPFSSRVVEPLDNGERPGKVLRFSLRNPDHVPPTVEPNYVERMESMWGAGSPMTKWWIDGVDAAGAGSLFPHAALSCHTRWPDDTEPNWARLFITIDPGWSTSATHALLVGECFVGADREWWVLGEWYFRGADSEPMLHESQVDSLMAALTARVPAGKPILVLVDPAETQFRKHIEKWSRKSGRPVGQVKGDRGTIDETLRALQGMLGSSIRLFHDPTKPDSRLPMLFRQLEAMSFAAAEASKSGADRSDRVPDPMGGNWDGVAALRYLALGLATDSIQPD